MTTKYRKTQLVIVAEAALEKALVRDACALGAQGWTVVDVRGAGREGVREGAWEADRTIELKLICDEAVADAIAEQVMARYAADYSVSLTFSEVRVLRPDRF
ncbi:MAG: transcriptional regulator [Rubrivivax sp.]|nr:transcriptional regulator [Rubrivivax sp.]MDH5338173.1 transcriptional regulator [Rubrivivax sp.]